MTATGFTGRALAEIDGLHRVLQRWFRAEGEADPALVLDHFDPGYTMVTVTGRLLTLDGLRAALPGFPGRPPRPAPSGPSPQRGRAARYPRRRQPSPCLLQVRGYEPVPGRVHPRRDFRAGASELLVQPGRIVGVHQRVAVSVQQ